KPAPHERVSVRLSVDFHLDRPDLTRKLHHHMAARFAVPSRRSLVDITWRFGRGLPYPMVPQVLTINRQTERARDWIVEFWRLVPRKIRGNSLVHENIGFDQAVRRPITGSEPALVHVLFIDEIPGDYPYSLTRLAPNGDLGSNPRRIFTGRTRFLCSGSPLRPADRQACRISRFSSTSAVGIFTPQVSAGK